MAASHDPTILPPAIAATLRDHRVTRSLRRRPRVYTDTTDFTAIDYGDVLLVEDRYFLVTAYTKEGRFGVDEQVKQWVPKVRISPAARRISSNWCFTRPLTSAWRHTIPATAARKKEARILEIVRGRPHFMQGELLLDEAGNLVGDRAGTVTAGQGHPAQPAVPRRVFFHRTPGRSRPLPAGHGCGRLSPRTGIPARRHPARHHVFVERTTGELYWIDFDYDFHLPERPFALDLFELGNILTYLVGRGIIPRKPSRMRPPWAAGAGQAHPGRFRPDHPEQNRQPAQRSFRTCPN